MQCGTLEVLLVGAKGLENTDFLRAQKQCFIRKGIPETEWNETFQFAISETGDPELLLKILDSDAGSDDDFVGETKILIEPVFVQGSVRVTTYAVVKDEEFRGEIRVGPTFTPEEISDRDFSAQEESYGGWKESTLD